MGFGVTTLARSQMDQCWPNCMAFTLPCQGYHALTSPPTTQTHSHTYTPWRCSTLYESYPIGNWLGNIACWVKDWVGGRESDSGGWGAGEKERESVHAAVQKTSKLSRKYYSTHTRTHTHTQHCPICLRAHIESYQISWIEFHTTLHFACIKQEDTDIKSAWVLEGGVAQCRAQAF